MKDKGCFNSTAAGNDVNTFFPISKCSIFFDANFDQTLWQIAGFYYRCVHFSRHWVLTSNHASKWVPALWIIDKKVWWDSHCHIFPKKCFPPFSGITANWNEQLIEDRRIENFAHIASCCTSCASKEESGKMNALIIRENQGKTIAPRMISIFCNICLWNLNIHSN